MLDKTVPFHTIIMKRAYSKPPEEEKLPDGYHIRNYNEGDEVAWANIEKSVLEFDTIEEAVRCYDYYKQYPERLNTCQWFVEAPNHTLVATATAWFSEYNGKKTPCVIALACLPEYQGLHLGKSVAIKMLESFYKYDVGKEVYLDTQTWSYKAIGLYLSLGFVPLKTETYNDCKNEYSQATQVLKAHMRKDMYDKFVESSI